MKRKTFLAFVLRSLAMMIVFIAGPLLSVTWQSFHNTQRVYREVTVESCTPGFARQICHVTLKSGPAMKTIIITSDGSTKARKVLRFMG